MSALGDVKYALGAIDVPHYNMYNAAKITGQPAPGYSSGQAIAAMERVADSVLPEGFSYEWTGTTFQEQKTGNVAVYIFALSIVCVFLFMAALYESWVRPLVIIFTVPLAMFGAVVGLWLYDMPLDVFGQIGLVMLIGLETKNAILIVEFGVELQKKHGMNIIDSAKEASRQRLRPILMTSFAFVMGVLPMARATGAGAYSRNSLGIVIAFGILISTVLGRFVIPIYYVLGERLIQAFGGGIRTSRPAPSRRRMSPRSARQASRGGMTRAIRVTSDRGFAFSSSSLTLRLDALGRDVELGGPEDRVQDELAEVGVAPVLVGVGAGESEAAAAVGPFDGPGEHLVAALGVDDVLVRAARRGRHALPGLVVGLGDEERGDAFHLGAEAHVEVPLVADGERLDAAGDRVLGQLDDFGRSSGGWSRSRFRSSRRSSRGTCRRACPWGPRRRSAGRRGPRPCPSVSGSSRGGLPG